MTEPSDEARTEPLPDIAVEVIGLNKWYGEFHVLRDINLKVARGERIVICGPSGGGKSTLLRCINRLEDWQQGRIVVDGIELTEDPKQIVAVRRALGAWSGSHSVVLAGGSSSVGTENGTSRKLPSSPANTCWKGTDSTAWGRQPVATRSASSGLGESNRPRTP